MSAGAHRLPALRLPLVLLLALLALLLVLLLVLPLATPGSPLLEQVPLDDVSLSLAGTSLPLPSW